MASEALQKFAEDLKLAREAKGISILQISSRTKIDPKFLTAIENAEFDVLPELYVKAFIKSFAQTIDLNPKEVIQKFENAKSGITEKPLSVVKEKVKEELISEEQLDTKKAEVVLEAIGDQNIVQQTKEYASKLDLNANAIEETKKTFLKANSNKIIGAFVLLIALIVMYFALIYESSPDIIINSQEDKNSNNLERYEVNKAENPVILDSLTSSSQEELSDSLRLRIQNSGQVWIKVLCDGRIVQQGTLKKDSTLNFRAKNQFGISVGNAGAVKLFYNDKPVKNVGNPGEIRNITITPDTIRYLTIRRNETKPSKRN